MRNNGGYSLRNAGETAGRELQTRLGVRTRFAGWALVGGVLSTTLVLGLAIAGVSSSSPLEKVSVITGSVSECGAGPSLGLPRTFVVTLHRRPGSYVVATFILKPSTHLSYYAFAVTPGTYYLSTNETNSPGPRGNIVVRTISKSIIEVPIATLCQ
jgi:hypothetical protein